MEIFLYFFSKAQIIWKCLHFLPKKMNKSKSTRKIVMFVQESDDTKRHFENNWPLVLRMCYKHPAQPNLLTTKNWQENLRMHSIISLEPGVAENFLQIMKIIRFSKHQKWKGFCWLHSPSNFSKYQILNLWFSYSTKTYLSK